MKKTVNLNQTNCFLKFATEQHFLLEGRAWWDQSYGELVSVVAWCLGQSTFNFINILLNSLP